MTANRDSNMDSDSVRDPVLDLLADRPALDYPYLRIGPHRPSASDVEPLLALARKENAPQRAISRATDGTWHTVDDIRDRHTWNRYDRGVRDRFGEQYALGRYPFYEARMTLRVRVPAEPWDEHEAQPYGLDGAKDFATYIGTWRAAVNDGSSGLFGAVSIYGGTVEVQ
jgi:hypothetical protein